jgi:hypothetical protein
MKRLLPILNALLAIVLIEAVLLLPPVRQRLDHMSVNPLPAKLSFLEKQAKHPPEILALGTSRTMNGFNAHAFEQATPVSVSAFNMGLPKAGYDWMLLYLREYLREYGRPKLVLLESVDVAFNKPNYSQGLYYQNLLERDPIPVLGDILTHPSLRLEDKQDVIVSALSGLHRYRKVMNPITLAKVVSGKHEGEPNPQLSSKGWQPLEHSTVSFEQKKLWIDAKSYEPMDDSPLTQVLSYCRAQSIPVAIVEWPDHPVYRRLAEGDKLYKRYKQTVARVAAAYQVPYIDLNAQNDSRLFVDPRHLNPSGARHYSQMLAQSLFNQPKVQAAMGLPVPNTRLSALPSTGEIR